MVRKCSLRGTSLKVWLTLLAENRLISHAVGNRLVKRTTGFSRAGVAIMLHPPGCFLSYSAVVPCRRPIKSLTKLAPREANTPVSSVPTHGQANSTPRAV